MSRQDEIKKIIKENDLIRNPKLIERVSRLKPMKEKHDKLHAKIQELIKEQLRKSS